MPGGAALVGGDALGGGVTVGAKAKVLANSFVLPNTHIPDGESWAGIPAQKIVLPKRDESPSLPDRAVGTATPKPGAVA